MGPWRRHHKDDEPTVGHDPEDDHDRRLQEAEGRIEAIRCRAEVAASRLHKRLRHNNFGEQINAAWGAVRGPHR